MDETLVSWKEEYTNMIKVFSFELEEYYVVDQNV